MERAIQETAHDAATASRWPGPSGVSVSSAVADSAGHDSDVRRMLSPPLHMVDECTQFRSKIAPTGVVKKKASKRRAILLKERD
jgi:hypothetical protein